MEVLAGCAIADVTSPAGLAMAGFVARERPAAGTHDPLTVRALAVAETALLVVDAIGIEADLADRIAKRSGLAAGALVVAALHTHGGPATMPRRLGGGVDPAYLAGLEDACVDVVHRARNAREPARLRFGTGDDPGVGVNRRHGDGPVDRGVSILTVEDADGRVIAALVSYSCHPVVLGADNLLWTADYPGFVRRTVEARFPGAPCLFVTGCAGDVNTGHSAHASVSLASRPDRNFAAAERMGRAVAEAALAARRELVATGPVEARATLVTLPPACREREPRDALARRWSAEAERAEGAERRLLSVWADWARANAASAGAEPYRAPISLLRWGGLCLGALPGEIFAQTALELRAAFAEPLILAAYAHDNPGYFPPAGEYAAGGYEVEEAHRFYAMPAAFAPGCAERLRDGLIALAGAVPAAPG